MWAHGGRVHVAGQRREQVVHEQRRQRRDLVAVKQPHAAAGRRRPVDEPVGIPIQAGAPACTRSSSYYAPHLFSGANFAILSEALCHTLAAATGLRSRRETQTVHVWGTPGTRARIPQPTGAMASFWQC